MLFLVEFPHYFNSIDELLDSAYHALFRVIVRNLHHVLHPLFPPRKRTICKLRKLSHGFTIPPVFSSLMRKNYLIRMLYTDVHWHLSFICVAFITEITYMYVFTVTSVSIVIDGNKETTYLLTSNTRSWYTHAFATMQHQLWRSIRVSGRYVHFIQAVVGR